MERSPRDSERASPVCRTKIAGAAVLGGRTDLVGRRAAKRGEGGGEPVAGQRAGHAKIFSFSAADTALLTRTGGTDFLRLTAKSIPPPLGHGEVLYLNTAAFFLSRCPRVNSCLPLSRRASLPLARFPSLPFTIHVQALVTRLFSFLFFNFFFLTFLSSFHCVTSTTM